MGVAASASASAAPGQKAPKPVVPDPPAYTKCIAHLKEIEPKPAKGQKPKTEAQLKAQCEQQYKALQQEVLGFLIGIDWVFGQAEEQGVKVSDKEVVEALQPTQEAAVPQGSQIPEVPGEHGSDRLRSAAAGEAQHAHHQNPGKGHQGIQEERERSGGRQVLQRTQVPLRPARKRATCGSSSRRPKPRPSRPRKKSNRARASRASPRANRSTPPARAPAAKWRAWSRARSRRRSAKRCSRPRRECSSGPVKTPFGYYIYEVKAVHAPTQQSSRAGEGIDQSSSSAPSSSRPRSPSSSRNSKRSGSLATECRAGYVVQECKQYNAPKTTSTSARRRTG